jgi:hypothetical protein
MEPIIFSRIQMFQAVTMICIIEVIIIMNHIIPVVIVP